MVPIHTALYTLFETLPLEVTVLRTTLNIDDDLLAAAKRLARRENASVGKVVSRMLRHALVSERKAATQAPSGLRSVAGFVPFQALHPGMTVSNADVDELRKAEGI